MDSDRPPLSFHGGLAGALVPLVAFLAGVIGLGLSGAPDERGFWPVLVAALALGLALGRDRHAYAETMIRGMSQPIVMLMVMAWMLAGILAALMKASGFVEALVWVAGEAGVTGGGYVAASFLVCCAVSTSTGTSLGTLLLTTPLLYPAGGALGAEPAVLVGAILGGATFGDNISPISDTTIASATTQGADLGGVVRSRMRYALPAAAFALAAATLLGGADGGTAALTDGTSSPRGLPMLLAPAFVLVLLLRRRHLVEGLMAGIVAAVAVGLGFGLLRPGDVLYVDAERFSARGLVVDGIEGSVGIVVFTLLLMGLVAPIEATGLLRRLVDLAGRRSRTPRAAELWIFAATSAAVVATTHSVVAILTMGELTRETGERLGIGAYRRSNLLDVTVCTYPFLLPYCIPTILAASLTAGSAGMPPVSAFTAGLWNFHSWGLLAVIVFAVVTGFGRSATDPHEEDAIPGD